MATGHPKLEAYSAFRLETRDFTQEMTHFTDNGVLSPEHMAAMSPAASWLVDQKQAF